MTDPVPTPNPLRPGARVVVRHRLPPGSSPSMTDVIGVVSAVDDEAVTLTTERGAVVVARADFVAAKAVPPRPTRRGPAHRAISVGDLERVMADGWSAVERAGLGDWLVRASSGFTGRGNSVLPEGDPSLPLPLAVDWCERWYAARGLPVRFHLDLPADTADAVLLDERARAAAVTADPLGAELLARGYRAGQPTLTMTGATDGIPPLREDSPPVRVEAGLETDWLMTYGRQRSVLPGVTEQLLTGSEGQLFASTGEPGRLTGVARMSVHPGWAGIHAVWVDPAHRRRGLAVALMSALATLAREHRMPSTVLQVEADNGPARRLYEEMGFRTHHPYVYVDQPTG